MIPPSKSINLYTQVPHDWGYESNLCLGFPTPVMFLYLADRLHMSVSRIREDMVRIAEVELEGTTLAAFRRKVRHGLIILIASDVMPYVCGEGGVLNRVAKGMSRKRLRWLSSA